MKASAVRAVGAVSTGKSWHPAKRQGSGLKRPPRPLNYVLEAKAAAVAVGAADSSGKRQKNSFHRILVMAMSKNDLFSYGHAHGDAKKKSLSILVMKQSAIA